MDNDLEIEKLRKELELKKKAVLKLKKDIQNIKNFHSNDENIIERCWNRNEKFEKFVSKIIKNLWIEKNSLGKEITVLDLDYSEIGKEVFLFWGDDLSEYDDKSIRQSRVRYE